MTSPRNNFFQHSSCSNFILTTWCIYLNFTRIEGDYCAVDEYLNSHYKDHYLSVHTRPSITSFLILHSFKVSKILSSLFVFIFIRFLLSIWINNHDSLFISIILIAIIILLVPLVMFLILMLLHFRLMILTLNLFLIETICCVIGSHWI